MRTRLILLWLLVGVIAALVCSLTFPAAHVAGEYVPVGNDSFYHARRILDTAADPSAFYQFDAKIHAPEGSLLTWPWGYDYALGWLARLAMMAGFSGPPMAFLIWVPVAAVFASVALMMRVARRMSLSIWSTALAALCVALSPLTQALHGAGVLDHHWAEYIFVLATIALGLKWFSKPEDTAAATVLGMVLGIAPAIHNGLFILQLPVLAMIFLWWLQSIRIPQRATLFFAGGLLVATLAVLIPSLPFRLGRFEYYTLSWFHLYAAGGTAIAAALLSALPRTNRNLALLGLAAAAYLLPLAHQLIMAHAFLVGSTKRLDVIAEMQSPRQLAASGGLRYVSTLYSFFIWLWPLTVGLCAYRAWAERTSGRLFFWVCAICGLSLLIMQFRMHYFGSFALFLPWLILVDELASRRPLRRKLILLSTSLVFLLMFVLPLRYSLPTPPSAGGDGDFLAMRLVLADLRKACATDPGVVLADNDAGHYIRYYTDCSVIANNFLLTKQHAEKIELLDHLLSLSADEMPSAAPYVRYVFLRPALIKPTSEGVMYVTYSQENVSTLISDLLLKPLAEVSPRYALIRQAVVRTDDPKKHLPYMRLFKVLKPSESRPRTSIGSGVTDNSRQ